MATVTFKSTPVHTAGELPKVGTKAPKFELVKGDLSTLKNDDLTGKRIVLNIFPSLDTSVCATSVRKFNQLAAQMDNTVVLGRIERPSFRTRPLLHDRRHRQCNSRIGFPFCGIR